MFALLKLNSYARSLRDGTGDNLIMNFKNSGQQWRVLQNMKLFLSESTRNFLARKFLQRAIKLGKSAGFWEKAAFDYDASLNDKLRGDR